MHTPRKPPGRTSHDDQSLLALSLAELAAAAGVSARTVRYYIAQGLLAGPGARGRQASYGEDHLLRLRLIRRLAERHTPLAQIRELVTPLTHDDLVALLGDEDQQRDRRRAHAAEKSGMEEVAERLRAGPLEGHSTAPGVYAAAPYGGSYEGVFEGPSAGARETAWRRWDLAPGVELHVRDDAQTRRQDLHDLIARLLREARAHERSRQDKRDGE